MTVCVRTKYKNQTGFRGCVRSWVRGVTHQSVYNHIEVMSDPKSSEADVTEIVGGENVHKGEGEEQQDTRHSWKTKREENNNRVLVSEVIKISGVVFHESRE